MKLTNKCDCGAPCAYSFEEKQEKEPCWGVVAVIDEIDGYYIHACKGHEDTWDFGTYKKENTNGERTNLQRT